MSNPTNGYSEEEIADTLAVQDILAENAEDFAALVKLKGMTVDMPGYAEFARSFARNIMRDQKLREEFVKNTPPHPAAAALRAAGFGPEDNRALGDGLQGARGARVDADAAGTPRPAGWPEHDDNRVAEAHDRFTAGVQEVGHG